MAYEQRALGTPGQRAEDKLLQMEGVSALDAGGFAKRDAMRQAVNERAADEKRMSRATNMAYRQAVRSGDRMGALAILQGAEKMGVTFGGVRAAGRAEEGAANVLGEEISTLRDKEQQEAGQVPAAEQLVSVADDGSDLLQERKDFDQELEGLRNQGRLDRKAFDAKAKELKIPQAQAESYWKKLTDTKISPGQAVEEAKNPMPKATELLRMMQEREGFLLQKSTIA